MLRISYKTKHHYSRNNPLSNNENELRLRDVRGMDYPYLAPKHRIGSIFHSHSHFMSNPFLQLLGSVADDKGSDRLVSF